MSERPRRNMRHKQELRDHVLSSRRAGKQPDFYRSKDEQRLREALDFLESMGLRKSDSPDGSYSAFL